METTFTELALLLWAIGASVVSSIMSVKVGQQARLLHASATLHLRMLEYPSVYEDARKHYEREKHQFFRRQYHDATGTEESK